MHQQITSGTNSKCSKRRSEGETMKPAFGMAVACLCYREGIDCNVTSRGECAISSCIVLVRFLVSEIMF